MKRIERIGDLPQAAVDVGQRNRREASEAAGMVRHQPGGVVVAFARQLARRLAGGEIERRRRHREHRDRDAGLVHVRQRLFDRPVLHQAVAETVGDRCGDIGRRRQMMVDVDTIGVCNVGRLRHHALRITGTDGGHRRGARHSPHEVASAEGGARQRQRAFRAAGAASIRPAVLALHDILPWSVFGLVD